MQVPFRNQIENEAVQVHITLYWPTALTKTNRENKNIKYNIIVYYYIYKFLVYRISM
jgi:hypothetical protein